MEKQAFFDGFYSKADGLPVRRTPSETEAITPLRLCENGYCGGVKADGRPKGLLRRTEAGIYARADNPTISWAHPQGSFL